MVDFNRGGTPLIEIVTEPDIPSPEAAREFLQQLRQTVMTLGVSECNMEEGQIRWDANVSVRRVGSSQLGTRTELKNMNSFRHLQQALDAEIPRQIEILEAGGHIDLETLHFDPGTGTTTPLRSKEEAHDYRYFPEPDLVPLQIDPAWVEELRASQPELPGARGERFMSQHGLPRNDARTLAATGALAGFYEEVVALGADPRLAANWTLGEYLAHLNAAGLEAGHGHATPERMAKLIALVADGTVSNSAGKEVFSRMIEERAEPEDIVREHGLGQISDAAELQAAVARVVADNPAQAQQYRDGKQQVLGFFVGHVMKATGGRANPKLVNELLRKVLAGG
jgi:aspartyl-tRNA(Asn)/glutamyl-tRNA(Gln) amidotransferase subunit B